MIAFSKPSYLGVEEKYILQVIEEGKLSGDGFFSKKCHLWLETFLPTAKALLTTSCTAALEMAAILIDVKPGDEIILPSYTFVSTANAFVLRGAKLIFIDIRPDTMNIDETKIRAAVTKRTKAIVVVHYAGVACAMNEIMAIANEHGLVVIEDAAQALTSNYFGRQLGTIGHLGCYSFHETKNYTCGEGGALAVNGSRFSERAEIIREKGTDRSKFFRGQIDKYTWIDIGSSYLPSEFNAAYLYAQLEKWEFIFENRMSVWNQYFSGLYDLAEKRIIDVPVIPQGCQHNAHMFYIKVRNIEERAALIAYLREQGIMSVFHYIPLHSSVAGLKYGVFHGIDEHTTRESERLIRLPLYYGLVQSDVQFIIETIKKFYS